MMRKFTFFLLLILTTVYAWADKKATLTAEAPDVVVSGDQFRLTFTVNTQKVKALALGTPRCPTHTMQKRPFPRRERAFVTLFEQSESIRRAPELPSQQRRRGERRS